MLAENCPHLEELGAKLEGGWYGQAGAMLPELVTCRIRVGATETLHALLVHAPRLEHLEVKHLVIQLYYRHIGTSCTNAKQINCISFFYTCEISGSYDGKYEDESLLGYCVM
jgi:hypothetical protein